MLLHSQFYFVVFLSHDSSLVFLVYGHLTAIKI